MVDARLIPDEVAAAIYALFPPGYLESIGLHPESIAAAGLAAWPQMSDDWREHKYGISDVLILPYKPQENNNDR